MIPFLLILWMLSIPLGLELANWLTYKVMGGWTPSSGFGRTYFYFVTTTVLCMGPPIAMVALSVGAK